MNSPTLRWITATGCALALFGAGLLIGKYFLAPTAHDHDGNGPAGGAGGDENTLWTCSMHPQIQQPKPGKCPICAMDLIPLAPGSGSGSEPVLTLSPAARALAGIQTAEIGRGHPEVELRLVGKLEVDPTRLRSIAARFPARIDRLFVDFEGTRVKRGDHLALVYSPELLSAQSELLTAIKFDPGGAAAGAARDKLRLWGLLPAQIDAIGERGAASDQLQINAPEGGVVIEKGVREGDYVREGSPLFKIADLSRLWLYLDAYESDLTWLRFGQEVAFEVAAFPGEAFHGTVAFIDPLMDERTRTIKVRVNVDNADGRLKPGMFVRARVLAKVASGGGVYAPELAGKWISPMHPEIVKDGPGACDVCGMDLVPAEELGYRTDDAGGGDAPVVVPATAVLRTGKRAVVYVLAEEKADKITFEGREITLGPRAGDVFVVAAGLSGGERVVVNGAFKIDSALQIEARPSMMNPGPGKPAPPAAPDPIPAPDPFKAQLDGLLAAYFDVQKALAGDDLPAAAAAAQGFGQQLGAVEMAALPAAVHDAWMPLHTAAEKAAAKITAAADIAASRAAFEPLSGALTAAVQTFGTSGATAIFEVHCPMAFDDKGAAWLQPDEAISNPYFGAEMLACGVVRGPVTGGVSPGGAPSSVPAPDAFKAQLDGLLAAYFDVQKALAGDDLPAAAAAAKGFGQQLGTVEMAALPAAVHGAWMPLHTAAEKAAAKIAAAADIAAARAAFEPLSGALTAAVQTFGPAGAKGVFEMFCPMAFDDKGAAWLQAEEALANPYFGAEMFSCGVVRTQFGKAAAPAASTPATPGPHQGHNHP